MKYVALAAILALLTLSACTTSPHAPSGAVRERIERDVHSLLMTQQAAWNSGDIPGFMEGYWRSEELVFTSGGRIRRGFEAALAGYEAGYTRETMGRLEFTDLEYTPISDDAVLVLGRWGLHDLATPSSGVFTLLVRKIDGAWRVVHDHTSSDAPKSNS